MIHPPHNGAGEERAHRGLMRSPCHPTIATPMSFIQAILDGLLIGGVYAVISIGLTLVYGVMGIVNFAQAEFLTIGMFVAWFAWAFLGLDPVLPRRCHSRSHSPLAGSCRGS